MNLRFQVKNNILSTTDKNTQDFLKDYSAFKEHIMYNRYLTITFSFKSKYDSLKPL